ncbi:MAG: ferredoxin--NADP(+) reductase [Idiomarina sp.]|nr:ferredoxin--NADP(+) reductase [Idiomarina sp.]
MPTWMPVQVVSVHHWHDGLFSLQLSHPDFHFKAGQFARVALRDSQGEPLPRAYSMVNAPGSQVLEFVIAKVADGALSPRLSALQPGQEILLNSHPSGFFSLDHVPEGDTLWMVATGTGIGPYLSILQQDDVWQRFKRVHLVHGVRYRKDLCYRELMRAFGEAKGAQFSYLPVVSREPESPNELGLHGRIPALIESGALEAAAQSEFNLHSQVMLCGNPAMIKDARSALESKGLRKHLRRSPGQITMEQYWAD